MYSAHPKKLGLKQRIARWLDPAIPQLTAAAEKWSPAQDALPQTPVFETAPQSTPPGGIMRVNPIRLKGFVREQITDRLVRNVVVHPPQYLLPPPLPRQQTGAMRPVSEPLKPVENAMPGWAKTDDAWPEPPAWLAAVKADALVPTQHESEIIEDQQGWYVTVDRADLFSDVEPSQTLEDDDNAPTEMTPRAKFQRAINGLLGKEESA